MIFYIYIGYVFFLLIKHKMYQFTTIYLRKSCDMLIPAPVPMIYILMRTVKEKEKEENE